MPSYEKNMYNYLKRKGLDTKYEHAGIYCIKLDNLVVYIGKSKNMLERVSQHYVGIRKGSERKYRIIDEVQRKTGCPVGFDVLYYAKAQTPRGIEEEIGEKEGEFIREHRPILNTQIPKAEDWHRWEISEVHAKEVLNQLLNHFDSIAYRREGS